MVKPNATFGRAPGAHTRPGAPLTSADWAARARAKKVSATAAAPRTSCAAPACTTAPSARSNDIGVEHGEERLEVAMARSGEEGVDDHSLAGETGVGNRGRFLHPAASTARQLPGRIRRTAHDGRDLVERHEHVVQHERDPLGGAQRIEDHQQRGTDRVGQ